MGTFNTIGQRVRRAAFGAAVAAVAVASLLGAPATGAQAAGFGGRTVAGGGGPIDHGVNGKGYYAVNFMLEEHNRSIEVTFHALDGASYDTYNLRYWLNNGEVKQVEAGSGRGGTFKITRPVTHYAGNVYHVTMQACTTHFLSKSTCTTWEDVETLKTTR